MSSKPNAVNIVVDWGTSNFRAYLVAENGNCLARADTAEGLNNVQQPFSEVLLKHIDPWLQKHGALVTVLCGMVGSPSGWHLVPHLPAPASLMQLTEHCHRLTDFTHCPAVVHPQLGRTSSMIRVWLPRLVNLKSCRISSPCRTLPNLKTGVSNEMTGDASTLLS